jgi:pimeloyl-ACP methyl ester carboxylesterase
VANVLGSQLNDPVSRRTLLRATAAACVLSTTRHAANAESQRPTAPGVNALQLATVNGGAGRPALFIHGFGSSKYTWRRVCAGLQDVFSYHAIDLPGHGESPAPADFNFSIENLSDVLARYVEARDFKNLTIVASSLGVAITLIAMLRNSISLGQRVSSLCVIDGACYPQTFPFFVDVLRWPVVGELSESVAPSQKVAETLARLVLSYCFFDDSRITEEHIKEYAGYVRHRENRRAIGRIARSIDTATLSRYVPLLKTIKVPCLLIWGSEDRVIPAESGRRLQRDLPNAQFVAIERCGHLPQEERPDDVVALMRGFYKT